MNEPALHRTQAKENVMNQKFICVPGLVVLGALLLAACGTPATPSTQVVQQTVVVPQTQVVQQTVVAPQTQVVPQTVIVPQTQVVEKVVTAPPPPAATEPPAQAPRTISSLV